MEIDFEPHAYVEELIESTAPQARHRNDPLPAPYRTVSIDAHLGDGLFLLNVLVHFHIVVQQGWLKDIETQSNPEKLSSMTTDRGIVFMSNNYRNHIAR